MNRTRLDEGVLQEEIGRKMDKALTDAIKNIKAAANLVNNAIYGRYGKPDGNTKRALEQAVWDIDKAQTAVQRAWETADSEF